MNVGVPAATDMDQRRASGRVADKQAREKAKEEAILRQQASSEPGLFSCYACRDKKRLCDKVQPCSR